ncbi:MAG: hypothetical protein ACYSUT_03415 [Planctomycetota bacterium]|jgi:hypothetical protein
MLNIFENIWLLISLAGLSLVVLSMLAMDRPEWGKKHLLVPLALTGLAFGLDYAVKTDTEYIRYIITTSKDAAAANNAAGIMQFVSPNYADRVHKSRQAMEYAMEFYLGKASIEKIKTQSHIITLSSKTAAESEFKMVIHLSSDSQYAAAGSIVFVDMDFEYEKIGKKWHVKRAELTAVNGDPMGWGSI